MVGIVPPSSLFGPRPGQIFFEGFCREEVTFVINWAESDKSIKESLGEWLKRNRPHKGLKTQNGTTAT
jgi:hypothetical protein